MKKTIAIIVAACAFIASVATNVYYIFDDDANTNPDVAQVIEKGKDVYNAAVSTDTSTQTADPKVAEQ